MSDHCGKLTTLAAFRREDMVSHGWCASVCLMAAMRSLMGLQVPRRARFMVVTLNQRQPLNANIF